jgi:hypothetical protein
VELFFEYEPGDEPVHSPWRTSMGSSPMLEPPCSVVDLLHQAVTAATVWLDGRLEFRFENDVRIEVRSRPDVEAWELSGPRRPLDRLRTRRWRAGALAGRRGSGSIHGPPSSLTPPMPARPASAPSASFVAVSGKGADGETGRFAGRRLVFLDNHALGAECRERNVTSDMTTALRQGRKGPEKATRTDGGAPLHFGVWRSASTSRGSWPVRSRSN